MIRSWQQRFWKVTASQLINPYTYEHLPVRPYISEEDIYGKVSQCASAYQKWRKVPLVNRQELVKGFVDRVLGDKQKLKPLISSFTGKSYKNIDEEFRRVQTVGKCLIDDSNKALKEKEKVREVQGKLAKTKIIQEGVGVTVIFPYSSEPIFDSIIHLIPCLISGNGALLKVSDFNNFLGEYLSKTAEQTLGREGLVNDTFIHPRQLSIFREFRSIKKVIYSGSQVSARKIFQQLVVNRFIDCNLYYGGQDAAFVDESADLALAATEICSGAFYNNGQSYDCIKRVYVHEAIEQEFINLLSERISHLVLGDPKDQSTDLGPITYQQSVLKFDEFINDAINFDGHVVIGGMTMTDGKQKGLFCEPTLITNCSQSMQILQEQLHAPILCETAVSSFQEFLQEVNDNPYGTGVRIFTAEPYKYKEAIEELQVGYISFNSANIIDSDLPIEGWKRSGKGKMLSQLSYEEYVVPKSIVMRDL